ncbi:MAG: NAD-dependent epimerase/dehydratase family protein [Candidatus Paceibacterota bacterium]
MNRNYLITGATGFVARNLYRALSESGLNNFTCLIRKKISESWLFSPDDRFLSYKSFWNERSNYSVYFHLAGKAHDLKEVDSEKDYYQVNFELTKKIYDRFLKDEKSEIFIFMSSVKAVTDAPNGWLHETDIPNPSTAYGKSKLYAEEYLLSKIPVDKTVIILRPCMIHGPGNKGNLNLLYSIVEKKIPWPLGRFDNQRSFLSIDNLIYVIEMILKGNLQNGIYNLADKAPISTNKIVQLISILNGHSPRIWNVPKSIVQQFAVIGDLLYLPFNSERLFKLTSNYLVATAKIEKELGNSLPISSIDGLTKTIESFKKGGNNF